MRQANLIQSRYVAYGKNCSQRGVSTKGRFGIQRNIVFFFSSRIPKMHVHFGDEDPDYEPSQESEDELCHSDCEGCDDCMDYSEEFFFEISFTKIKESAPKRAKLYRNLLINIFHLG